MMENLTYRKIKVALADAGIEDHAFEATELILHFCHQLDRARLAAEPDAEIISPELAAALEKRISRYPLQYIIGTWDFCNEHYRVTPDCLIPRPETELLVELAAKFLPENASFLDLCTGSGCIAVSTLTARQDTTAIAVDLFDGTLALARENAESNGVFERVEFKKCDILLPNAPDLLCGSTKFDAILSNPPYVKTEDMSSLEPELLSEPYAAFDGGDDGLVFYRAIIKNFAEILSPDGFMLFEAGYDTARAVAALGRSAGFCAEVIPDLSGIDRMVLLRHII